MSTGVSDLNGLFKEAYGDDLIDLIPEAAMLAKKIKFVSSEKQDGNKYNQPVILADEQGVTYAAPDSGAFALEDAVPMTTKNASLQGISMLIRSALDYEAAAKASNSKKAFVKATQLILENMSKSIYKRLEVCLMHGRRGLGLTSAVTVSTATVSIVQVTTGTWATGIWAGSTGAKLNFYNVATLISSGVDSIFSVTAVNTALRQITVTGTSAGSTALVAATASPLDVYYKGTFGVEAHGLRAILQNTGTLFGIDAGIYDLWKGNSVTVSGAMTFAKLLNSLTPAVQRGLDEDVCVLVNPATFQNLANDIAALRVFDQSYTSGEAQQGSRSIKFFGQGIVLEISSYNLVKEGELYMFPPKKCLRIGAQEISMKTPGRSDEIFLQLPSSAGYEMRMYSNQALFLETPARGVYVSGFTNA